jgi:hypothetical protein
MSGIINLPLIAILLLLEEKRPDNMAGFPDDV